MKIMKLHLSAKEYVVFIMSLIIIVLSSFSYAFYLNVDNTLENVATTECIKITYVDKDDINIEKTYPLSEEEGSKLTPYEFTITNVCTSLEDYQVNIETLNESTIQTSNIRVKLDNNESSILGNKEEVLNYVNSDIKESRKIETGILNANGSRTYKLRMWIDEDSTVEETANKEYKSKVVIMAVPKVNIMLNTNGGEIATNVVTREVGRTIGELEEPIKSGYKFLGWYLDSEFKKEVRHKWPRKEKK